MKKFNKLIHIHQIEPNLKLLTLVYNGYLDEIKFLNIILYLYKNLYNKKEMLLPFSINYDSKIVIFYNIYNKMNFKKLNNMLKNFENINFYNASYICIESKINSNLKPVSLPNTFNNLGQTNIKLLSTYLKETEYKIYNLNDHGITAK